MSSFLLNGINCTPNVSHSISLSLDGSEEDGQESREEGDADGLLLVDGGGCHYFSPNQISCVGGYLDCRLFIYLFAMVDGVIGTTIVQCQLLCTIAVRLRRQVSSFDTHTILFAFSACFSRKPPPANARHLSPSIFYLFTRSRWLAIRNSSD